MQPWYKGFQGTIERVAGKASYLVSGVHNVISDTELEITELPICKWTREYKDMLETMIDDGKNEKCEKLVDRINEYH